MEPNWKPRRWVWGVWATIPCLVVLAIPSSLTIREIVGEGGPVEQYQVALWLVAALSACFVAPRLKDAQCRWTTLLLGVLASGAMARELDLHILFNPKFLGAWGVRFRMDWWLSGEVAFLVKSVWAVLIASVGGLLIFLAIKSYGPVDWRRARPRFMVAMVVCGFLGFAMDDLLRRAAVPDVRKLIEEVVELLAGASALCAVLAPESAAETETAPGGKK